MKQTIIFSIACLFIIMGCEKKSIEHTEQTKYQDKKILVVHSYHSELDGVIKKTSGLVRVFENEGVEYKIIYMDTKRNIEEAFKKKSA